MNEEEQLNAEEYHFITDKDIIEAQATCMEVARVKDNLTNAKTSERTRRRFEIFKDILFYKNAEEKFIYVPTSIAGDLSSSIMKVL